VTATTQYSPKKFLWASIAFFLLLFIFSFLVMVYSQQMTIVKDETISPLASITPTIVSQSPKEHVSKYNWKVSYPQDAQVDTSIDPSSTSLERVTLSAADPDQPAEGFYGYSVDFSVENKAVSLSNFADRDSLSQSSGARQYFTVTTLGNKSGYKTLIRGQQEYINYYLPLKDETKVLVVTTTIDGVRKDDHEKTVNQILETLELLD
jgi:hypothetical protein